MAWLSTEIDLGDCGACSVQVEYKHKSGATYIESVMWNGTDIVGYLNGSAEDALADICRAHIREENQYAAEAYWEAKREERRVEA